MFYMNICSKMINNQIIVYSGYQYEMSKHIYLIRQTPSLKEFFFKHYEKMYS